LLLIWDGLGVGANSVLASIRFAWGTIFLEHGGRHVCFWVDAEWVSGQLQVYNCGCYIFSLGDFMVDWISELCCCVLFCNSENIKELAAASRATTSVLVSL
jgi:hypothetical protein